MSSTTTAAFASQPVDAIAPGRISIGRTIIAAVESNDRRLNITERGGTRTSDITTIKTAPQNQMRVASVEWYCGEAVGSRATEKSSARQIFPRMLRRRSQVEGVRPVSGRS